MNNSICVLLSALSFAVVLGVRTAFGAFTFDEPGFELTLRRAPSDAATIVGMTNVVRTSRGDGVVTYFFADGSPVVRFVARGKSAADGTRRYRAEVSVADGWHLEKTAYPLIDVAYPLVGDGMNEHCVVGATVGGFWRPSQVEVGKRVVYSYPGSLAAQFAAAYGEDVGFYFATDDAVGFEKALGFVRRETANRFVHEAAGWDAGTVTGAYDVVARKIVRTEDPLSWEDFADEYRRWLHRQPWMAKTYLERTDVPAWLKTAPAMLRYTRQWLAAPEKITESLRWWKRTFGETDVIAAIWGWEKVGTWWGPDYFPAFPDDATIKSETALMRKNGFHPFGWPSCYNWSACIGGRADGSYRLDYRDTYLKRYADLRVVTREGKAHLNPAPWMDNGANAAICGGYGKSQAWLRELSAGLAARGFDMIQFDQSPGGRLIECWSANHGHPAGPGAWNFREFMNSLRAMKAGFTSVAPDGAICVEQPHEQFSGVCHLQDYRNLEFWAEGPDSIYSYLHHGYLPMFQSNPYRNNLYAVAFMAVDGQIPFYKLLDEDLLPERPAIENGSFETRSDNARMAALGWEVQGSIWLSWTKGDAPLWNFEGAGNWQGAGDWEDVRHGKVSYLMKAEKRAEQCAQTVRGVKSGKYILSAWVKTDRAGAASALLWGDFAGEKGRLAFPKAGVGWRRISGEVTVEGPLRIILYAGRGTVAHVDDVRLEDADGKLVTIRGESPYLRMMKNWIRLYQGEGRDFLAYGFREKPPRLACATFKMAERTYPAVVHAAYRSVDGRHALAVANATHEKQTFKTKWRGWTIERSLEPCEIEIVENRE